MFPYYNIPMTFTAFKTFVARREKYNMATTGVQSTVVGWLEYNSVELSHT
jgi:hypothetical protein